MWFIENTLKGVKPPTTLAPDMVPPCMRPKVAAGAEAVPGVSSSNYDVCTCFWCNINIQQLNATNQELMGVCECKQRV
jgi:hypothetical protein